jgi:hypothetical protein
MKSESIKELALALSKAQGLFDHAKKDVSNDFFKKNYADLASVIDAAKKPLSDNGLSIVQLVDTDQDGSVSLETILMHISGEWISGKYPIKPMKPDPQSYGSAITYARRYAFSAITGIAADDDDGESASDSGIPPERVKSIGIHADMINKCTTVKELEITWGTVPEYIRGDLNPVKVTKYRELIAKESA